MPNNNERLEKKKVPISSRIASGGGSVEAALTGGLCNSPPDICLQDDVSGELDCCRLHQPASRAVVGRVPE